MQEEIEDCLRPVIATVAGSPGARDWSLEMLRSDRISCLCERELAALPQGTFRNESGDERDE